MIESGSCGSALISTTSECEAAATALDLSDKTADDYTLGTSSYYPLGCAVRWAEGGRDATLIVFGGGIHTTGSCSSGVKCICRFTPPSPPALPPSPPALPSPPFAPPMPPGYLQIAGGYYVIESGSCGSAHWWTKSECEAAATALDLGDKTINNWDDRTVLMDKTRHCVFDWGSLVMRGDYKSSSQTWPSIKCSEGKKGMQCICKSAPPSPPAPPPAPPMRPGHVQTAGGYTMIESGSCGSALISTTSECEAAAKALDLPIYTLSDTRAYDGTSSTSSYHPPGCVYARGPGGSSYLGVWGGGSTGSCSSDEQCICRFTHPSPPPSPPSPPQPPPQPPSPPSPPSPPMPPPSPPTPPMLPGHVQTAGGYTMIESGYCGNAKKSIVLIKTTSECEAAATALDLSDKPRAYDGTSYKSSEPPGCVSYGASGLYVWSGSSTGSCSSFKLCICKDPALLTPP